MSDPRFRPRELVRPAQRRDFGKVLALNWIDSHTDLEASRIAAAQLQHALAVRITRQLKGKGLSIRDYAALAHIGYDRMAKVLRGEAVMRLEDVADAQRLLGEIADPLLEEVKLSEPGARSPRCELKTEADPTQPHQDLKTELGQSGHPHIPQLDLLLEGVEGNARITVRWSQPSGGTKTYSISGEDPAEEQLQK